MKQDIIKIEDKSNDRNYFTIIPNYILNHSTAIAQSLYLQLKRLAGENETTKCSRQYLMDKLGITKPTLLKELKYLIDKKWIEEAVPRIIETDGGKQQVKSYKIIDLWHLNNEYYKGGKKEDPPIEGGKKYCEKGVKQGGKKYTHKEEPLEEEPPIKKNLFFNNKEFADAWKAFKEMRTKMKRPMTQRAEELLLARIEKLTQNAEQTVKILEQSIQNSWKGVFPLKIEADPQEQEARALVQSLRAQFGNDAEEVAMFRFSAKYGKGSELKYKGIFHL